MGGGRGAANLADMQFLLCAIGIFSKYIPLKDKKGVSIVDAFQQILKESKGRKPTKYGLTKEANFTIVLFKNS